MGGDIKIHTPLKSIRLKCLDCCCGNVAEVRRCEIDSCTLWPYRFGKRPSTVGIREAVRDAGAP